MASSSKILLDLIGPISQSEDFSKISINCSEEDEFVSSAGLEGAKYEVLFPKASSEEDVVPLIGGAIMKLSLGNELKPLGPLKSSRYDAPVKALEKYISSTGIGSVKAGSGEQRLSVLTAARVAINKALQNMPNITTGLNSNQIPTVYLSSLRGSYSGVSDVNNSISESGKSRLSSMSKIGGLKFIPFDKVKTILEALTFDPEDFENEDYGLSNYVGLSGKTFRELRIQSKSQELSSNPDEIAQILLDLFPIFHIEEKFLEGKRSKDIVGYCTAIDNDIYIKTPDISGRNSSGITNLEVEDEEDSLFFCLELANKQTKDYKALAFEYAAPPDIKIEDGEKGYPLNKAPVSISIFADGHDSSFKYFLSPIISPKQSPSLPKEFVKISGAVEMFTAPVISLPYFDPENKDLKPIISFDDSEHGTSVESIFSDLSAYLLSSGSPIITNPSSYYAQKSLGLPLSVSLNAIGVPNITSLLGELNRPDMLMGSRDFSKETYIKNDRKWFNQKICSAKSLMVSVCPNILTDISQVPANWIRLEPKASGEYIDLSVPYDHDGLSKRGLSGYSPSVTHQFALYAMDEYGQIVRVPGENISISPQVSIIEGVTPDGFAGGLLLGSDVTSMTLSLDREVTDASVRIFSDLNTSEEINVSDIAISSQGSGIIISSSEPLVESLFENKTGIYYIQVVSEDGSASDNLGPIAIFPDFTDLPARPEDKIEFKVLDGLTAPRFGKEIDSIPLLMDGEASAEIILKYSRPVFREGLPLYGYIGILNDSERNNLSILKEDIGWTADNPSSSPLALTTLSSTPLIVPTKMEYVFGTDDFSRINNHKVKLKFPGPGAKLNISRFNELVGEDRGEGDLEFLEYPRAYIILSNKRIHDKISLGASDFAMIPIGSTGKNGEKPAFINPPYVNALAMKLSNVGIGNSKSFSNVTRSSLEPYRDYISGINIDELEDESELRTNNKIARLSVLFEGYSDEPRISRSYKVSIGSGANVKKIRGKRLGLIRGEKNKLIANYIDIRGVSDTGFLDIIVTKKDRRFNVTYDSVVRKRLTVDFEDTEEDSEIIDESIVKSRLFSSEDNILAKEANKLIPKIIEKDDGTNRFVPFPNIFPASLNLSPIPLRTGSYIGNDDASNVNSYLNFPNPIKIFPSVDLVFGAEEPKIEGGEEKIAYGMLLSDITIGPERDKAFGEIVKINTSGSSEVLLSLSDVSAGIERIREQGSAQLKDLNAEKEALKASKDDPEGLLSDEKIQEIDGKIQAIEEKEAAYNSALTAADAAVPGTSEVSADDSAASTLAAGAAGAAEATGAVVGAANDALGLLEDGLALIQTLTDKLSSLTGLAGQISEGLEQSASAMGPRESDFSRVNIKNIFIDKESSIPTSFIDMSDDATKAKLVLDFRFGQTSAIKFNVPEIIRIIGDGGDEYVPDHLAGGSGDKPFSKFVLKSGQVFYIVAEGATRNTKIELGGRRIKILEITPESIYLKFKVKAPNLSKTSAFGGDDCITLALTNSSEKHIQVARQIGNDIAIDLDKKIGDSIDGGSRNKRGLPTDLKEKLSDRPLKFTSVILDKANVPKEFIQSFCDMSFHLTGELALQLRNFKVLLVPIKVIFCIIDVICALLNPIALVFAIIRLFLCLYDLILLLPQLSVPAMLLALVLHVIELLLCIILKVLSTVNAINEISTAIKNAVEQRNYPAIIALEETISEHLASLEADLTVLDPILNILALFLELLSLTFAFPCQIKTDADEEACIDPSQLAGLIMSKVVPAGRIVPDALLPMAQTYTTLPVDDVGSAGNTPPAIFDLGSILSEVSEQGSGVEIVSDNTGFGGRPLPGIRSSLTGDNILIEEGGFFEGDLDGNGEHDNVNYQSLRFNGGDFEGTFGLSFSRSIKEFAIFTGPDPRMVWFEFNESGKTAPHAFIPFFAPFFDKKTIDNLQTLDSPPSFLKPDGNSLKIAGDMDDIGFVSPIDGASDKDATGGFFLERGADLNGARTYQPKPLTVTFELQEPGVNPDTLSAEFTPVEVTKTFGSIPMIALIDDEFNIYFVEAPGTGQGGIIVEDVNGVPAITAIHAKMMNFPTAPKKAFTVEGREIYLSFAELNPDPASTQAASLEALENDHEINAGEILIWQQANYNAIAGSADQPFEFFADGTAVGDYDYVGGSPADIDAITRAANTINVFDFPRLYVVDMRQLSGDIAAACGASGPTELLLDLPGFTEPDKIEDSIGTLTDCLEAFLSFFHSEEEDSEGIPIGIIPKIRNSLELGKIPSQISVQDVVAQYNTLKECYEDEVDNICGFVINPLNTSFKIENDDDETALAEFVNPEQEDLATLAGFDIVDELEFDEELAGFPQITGAMEYASGIGDSATVAVGSKAIVKIIPRDCYDEVLAPALDLTDSIKIDFLKDETGGAELVAATSEDSSVIFEKEGGEYTFAVTAPAAGKVQIRATICSTVVQAVTDRGIVDPRVEAAEVEVDCVDDSTITVAEASEEFAPGALSKVDRILTVLFVPAVSTSGVGYGDEDRENSAKSSKPSPQTFGTKLEN
jgi:hypothetical protein